MIPHISNRREFLTASGLLAAGAVGLTAPLGALASATPSPTPFAWSDPDLLQTLASIENLAIATYQHIETMSANVNGSGNAFVTAVFHTAAVHHRTHLEQLNSALSGLGAPGQTKVDAKLQSDVVGTKLAAAQDSSDVLAVVVAIEDAAAQTYVRFSADSRATELTRLFALVAPVEAQHVTALLMLEALTSGQALGVLGSDRPLPPDAAVAGLTNPEISARHSRLEREGAVS